MAAIKLSTASLNKVYDSISGHYERPYSYERNELLQKSKAVKFSNQFKIQGLYYNYPGHKKQVLKNINFTVNHNEVVGVIGATGAG